MIDDELKQRLIELLKSATCEEILTNSDGEIIDSHAVRMVNLEVVRLLASHLIRNGVTIRERGEWKDNIFCSRCGYAAEDDEGHILMSFDDFCPHCGADMRGGAK